MTQKPRLLIVGRGRRFHLGAILLAASYDMHAQLVELDQTNRASWLVRQFNHKLRGHRPPQMKAFGLHLIEVCRTFQPDYLLVTGIVPPDAATLKTLHTLGIYCINFLTDDPWGRIHRGRWFFKALRHYDLVLSPRRANLSDLETLGCRTVYMPFGYDPALHFQEAPPEEKVAEFDSDVLFYGGADADRLPYIKALLAAGFKTTLYGGRWKRYAATHKIARGTVYGQTLRWAVNSSRTTLCLVRRANRDEHVMRTYEAPAMGGCMLMEDTADHRAIFGPDGEAVVYFKSPEEMVEQARRLLADTTLQSALRYNAHRLITEGQNTYADRLRQIIEYADDHQQHLAG